MSTARALQVNIATVEFRPAAQCFVATALVGAALAGMQLQGVEGAPGAPSVPRAPCSPCGPGGPTGAALPSGPRNKARNSAYERIACTNDASSGVRNAANSPMTLRAASPQTKFRIARWAIAILVTF